MERSIGRLHVTDMSQAGEMPDEGGMRV